MKRASEVRYAVARDETVRLLRQRAYRDGIRDAMKVCITLVEESFDPVCKTVADHLAGQIKSLKRRYR